MADDGTIIIDSKPYEIAAETGLPSGRRSLIRSMRESQPSDPARIGQSVWQLGGTPIGRSREDMDGGLATDYADNIETLYDDLLTASPAPNNVTLSGLDPAATTSAKWGEFKWGGAKWAGGTAISVAGNAAFADFQAGQLFIGRGPFCTQVNSSFAAVDTESMGSIIEGMANWQGAGWVGLGAGRAMQKRTGVSSTTATYSGMQISAADVFASYLKRGDNRLWFVDPINNQARYTFDAFVTQSNPFTIGDDGKQLTGIITSGPFTLMGALDGVFGFTDSGKPVVVEDLEGEESVNNGSRGVALWGWAYYITDLGLRAWVPNVSNPVGIESLTEFEGPIDGRPTAVWSWRGNLFVAYLTTSGDTYIVRGVFGPATESTGLPLWYPFKKLSSVQCDLLYSTPRSFATNPRILAGRGTNITTYIMGRRGRDIADANYSFSTEGGQWFGTTMTGHTRGAAHLHRYLRKCEFFTEQCSATKTWALAVSCDGAAYVNVGSAVTSNGHQVLRPVSGGVPLTTVDFHSIKPRLTQVNDSTTLPPQIRGHLTLTYDERPDMVEEVQVALRLNPGAWERLKTLVGHDSPEPVVINLPGERETRYGFVTALGNRRDTAGDAVESVAATILMWNVS